MDDANNASLTAEMHRTVLHAKEVVVTAKANLEQAQADYREALNQLIEASGISLEALIPLTRPRTALCCGASRTIVCIMKPISDPKPGDCRKAMIQLRIDALEECIAYSQRLRAEWREKDAEFSAKNGPPNGEAGRGGSPYVCG